MKLTFDERQALGLQYLFDLLHPATPFGAQRLKEQHLYGPEERDLLLAEQDNVAILAEALDRAPDGVAALERAMGRVKDVRGSLRRCAQTELDELELFQLSAFLQALAQIVPLARALPGYDRLHGAALTDVDGPLAVLDPAHTGKLTFYIEDARTPGLLAVRHAKAQVERELALCPREERPALLDRRQHIVKEEERELAAVYSQMSRDLRPFLPALLDNTQALAVLDSAIQKAWLARRFPSVRPVVDSPALVLEEAVNPMLAEDLAAQGRSFTPISLRMDRGVTVLTGANMGGKSVAMQTVALNAALALMGCFVFARRGEVPLFLHMELINRDFSSVRQGLSSFGGEIQRFNEAARRLSPDAPSLLILDEFARGTNADEGSAILRAVVTWLGKQNAYTLLATHYDGAAQAARAHYQVKGLSRLPQSAADPLRAIAESMDYGLIPVEPGRPCPKDAVKICRILGMDEEIVKNITNSP